MRGGGCCHAVRVSEGNEPAAHQARQLLLDRLLGAAAVGSPFAPFLVVAAVVLGVIQVLQDALHLRKPRATTNKPFTHR